MCIYKIATTKLRQTQFSIKQLCQLCFCVEDWSLEVGSCHAVHHYLEGNFWRLWEAIVFVCVCVWGGGGGGGES